MKRFEGYVSLSLVGCKKVFEFEVDDDASEKDIEDAGRDAMFEQIEYSFKEVS